MTVDPSFPVDNSGNLAYAKLGTGNSIWVPIVEKAFCYFRDPSNISYQAIAGGWSEEAFADFGSTDATALKNTQAANGQAVVATDQPVDSGRPDGDARHSANAQHARRSAYVFSCSGELDGTIELRNPWGCNPIDRTTCNWATTRTAATSISPAPGPQRHAGNLLGDSAGREPHADAKPDPGTHRRPLTQRPLRLRRLTQRQHPAGSDA